MRSRIIKSSWAVIIFILSACNIPSTEQTFSTPTSAPSTTVTLEIFTPSQEDGSGECGFMWAHEALPELSDRFYQALQDVIPDAQGYAQAYGENCVAETGEVIRFLAMETDFYITLKVDTLENKQTLGELIEGMMKVLAEFPTGETPGPQPGYIGINFESPEDNLNLWVLRTEAESALENGLRGEELFNALRTQ